MTHPLSDSSWQEIVIANLGPVCILVPTRTVYGLHSSSILGIPIPQRVYSETGWMFDPHTHCITGTIQGLRLTSPFPDGSPFKVAKRLAQDVPLSFELSSSQPFSAAIASLALFQYQFQENLALHYGIFRNLRPSFVRIYPFKAKDQFPMQVARCIHEEINVKLLQHLRLENENNLS